MGDSASNIGRAGHNQRHQQTVCCGTACAHHMQGVWGTLVEMEPQDHLGYSNDYRPDVSGRGLGKARTRLIGDVKFKGPPLSFVGKKLLGREANATTVRWRSFEQLRVVTARYSDVQPLLRFRDHLNGQGVASGVRWQFNAS